MVFIDSDVLLLAFAFQRDDRQATNTIFLASVQNNQPAITIYNLMEVLGSLSFNLSRQRLEEYRIWLVNAYQLKVIWPQTAILDSESFFRTEIQDRPFVKMCDDRMAFLDALVLGLAERTPDVECFVTWNARHFKNKTTLQVFTPTEYLAR